MNNLKKDQAIFLTNVIEYMKELDLSNPYASIDNYINEWEIKTKFGPLSVHLYKNQDINYSIFCRFLDKEKYSINRNTAIDLRINLNSGKWNFHYQNPERCLEVFKNNINNIKL